MASAILTILYPEDFTVYDVRVCNMLRINCKDLAFSDNCRQEYQSYKDAVWRAASIASRKEMFPECIPVATLDRGRVDRRYS